MENKTCECSNNLLHKIDLVQEFINDKLLDINKAECSRINNENERIKNENSRKEAETKRVANEEARQDSYTKFSRLEDLYASNEKDRLINELERINYETTREHNETYRKDAELSRQEFEKSRLLEENKRVASEITRINNENLRKLAEEARVNAENIRIKNNIGAENVNAELSGTKINITNRKGETKSLELVDIDEHVTVTMKTKIADVTLSGMVLNVFRNHGETPELYTTNDLGVVTFSVTRGTYYEIHFPDVGIALPIDPIGYTATLPVRNIEVEYIPAAEGPLEHVTIELYKALLDGTREVFPNINFSVLINNGDVLNYTVDALGQYQFDVPVNKKYTVTFTQQEGFYNTTSLVKEFTASSSNRIIRLLYYTYKNGIFIVTEDGQEYTLDLFKTLNLDKTTAKMVAVYERNLIKNNGIIYASIKDLSTADYPNKLWCNQNVLFNDIPSNGNDVNAMYYYDGNGATIAILLEAKERNLICDAATYARTKLITIDGNTMYGYLPSIGLIYTFQYNSTAIDEILKYIVGDNTKTVSNNFTNTWKWTSCQNGASCTWNYLTDLYGNRYKTDGDRCVACFYAY